MPRLSLIIVALFASWVAAAADLTGRASVIDGDTIEIHGQRIRLFSCAASRSRSITAIELSRQLIAIIPQHTAEWLN
jgi:endonuclease YncB( thermonuclease family)